MGAVFGIATLVSAVGLILTGRATMQAGLWRDWRRFTPLVAGVWTLVLVGLSSPTSYPRASPSTASACWRWESRSTRARRPRLTRRRRHDPRPGLRRCALMPARARTRSNADSGHHQVDRGSGDDRLRHDIDNERLSQWIPSPAPQQTARHRVGAHRQVASRRAGGNSCERSSAVRERLPERRAGKVRFAKSSVSAGAVAGAVRSAGFKDGSSGGRGCVRESVATRHEPHCGPGARSRAPARLSAPGAPNACQQARRIESTSRKER